MYFSKHRCIIVFIVIFQCLIPSTFSTRHHHHLRKRLLRKAQPTSTQKTQTSDDINHLTPVNVLQSDKSSPNRNPPDFVASRDGKLLDTEVFKSLVKELIARLDEYSVKNSQNSNSPAVALNIKNPSASAPTGSGNVEGPRHINSLNVRYCALHGLWLSTVAGAAIELIPEQRNGHIEIRTKIFELPDNPYPPLITSQWTGKGIISQESPTTLTIVFQEHVEGHNENNAKERTSNASKYDTSVDIQLPRTAVFVGQCLVCRGSPMLQGTWVVFPATQTCTTTGAGGGISTVTNEKQKLDRFPMDDQNQRDSIFLLRLYH